MYKTRIDVFRGKVILLVVALILPLLFALDTSAATLSMTISSSSLALTMVPNSAEGTFASSDDLNVSVSLSGVGGYTLGIKAASSAASARTLINSAANAALATISSAITPANYADNTYANTNSLNNTWGYLPSKYNSAANTSYRPAPTADGDILDVTSEAGNNTAVNYTISIGARADTSTKPGTYSNTFVIFAVANHPDCNPSATTIDTAVCMQDMNDNVINSMEPEVQYQLYDNRDYKKYYIAKMKDGRVWMTQNLDLDLETSATNVAALTSLNTDLNTFGTDNYTTANGYTCSNPSTTTNCTANGEVITWTPANATTNVWTASNYVPYSLDYGDRYEYLGTSGASTTYQSTSFCESAHPDGTCPHYHVGNYYNWTAAVASNSTSGLSTNYKAMDNSICPVGWRLPNGRTSTTTTDPGYYSEINYTWKMEGIVENYFTGTNATTYLTDNGWKDVRDKPLYSTPAGYIRSNNATGPTNLSSDAKFWTSTIYSGSYAYENYAETFNPYVAHMFYRSSGISVRCIAKQDNTGSTIVTFDKNANDATGSMSNQTINANHLANVSNNSFARSGYVFNSWNTEPDGSGTTYNEGDQFYGIAGTATTNVMLYAQWDKGYTVTFKTADANITGIYFDGTKYTNNQTVMAYEGHTYNISGDYTTKHGFSSWTITAGSLANSSYPSTTFTMPSSNVTITLASQEATVDISSLQNSSTPVSNNCNNEAITPILVYDPRDNEAYYVARLCDGNYWMLDNLRLDLTNTTVINNLSTYNTNASAEALGYLKNGGGSTTDQWPTAGLSGANWTTSYSYSAPLVHTSGTVTAGSNQNTWTGSYTKDTVAPVTYGPGSGKIGVYYNYCAASAGTYCWGNGINATNSPTTDPNTTTSPTARDIEGDICPKGWRLPTGGDYNDATGGGEFQNLYNKYSYATTGQLTAFQNAFSLALSGGFSIGNTINQGFSGSFWSSTWYREQYNYNLIAGANNVLANIMDSDITGLSVRCVFYDPVSITVNFANGVESVTFKKEDGPAQTLTTSGSTVTLERNKTYYVSIISSAKYAVTGWSATAGDPTSSTRGIVSYTPSGDATITIASQQATTDITSLVASTDPVSSNCKNEAVTPILVYDSRDNEAYWVARLCDGKYWMLDNLRLDLTNSTVINALSTTNTNADQASLDALKGITVRNVTTDPNGKYATAGLSGSNWTSSYSYSVPQANVSGTVNDVSNNSPSNYKRGPYTKDTVIEGASGQGSGKIGVYYNYCAASAGSYCYGNGTSTTGSPSTDPNTSSLIDIDSDICPKGWHIPTSGSSGEYRYLTDQYNIYDGDGSGSTALVNAFSGLRSGYYYSGYASRQGYNGEYWSSTWKSLAYMYYAAIHDGSISYMVSQSSRNIGLPVRCVLGS